MDAFQILVIILSVFLTVALILTIVALVYILKTVKSIKQISQKAASVVDSASNVSKFVNPAVAGKFIYEAVVKTVNNHKKEK
jgi:biopolymer transport protein ExbB/TolQ